MLVSHLLLSPQLHHFPVRVRVPRHHERRTRSRSVLRHEPPRFVPHSARVAQRLGTHRPRPPLWRLIRRAVETPSLSSGFAFEFSGAAAFVFFSSELFLLRTGLVGAGDCKKTGSPRGGCRAWSLASRFGGNGDIGVVSVGGDEDLIQLRFGFRFWFGLG
ncbi:hypothetical protein F2Q68_00028988 [Brassica cretica]|uniref:Uncharacterized protein n=1 Tax=Brassica cretica TaxID=69181 RepID=A0A8S9GEQ2_BRACR|nr:hypothetical protein F2Q68_00028988 [Brassica cretica]